MSLRVHLAKPSALLTHPKPYILGVWNENAQRKTVQFTLCGTFLGGHIWHALKSKSQGQVLNEEDKFKAIMAGFIVLAVIVISLVLLSAV